MSRMRSLAVKTKWDQLSMTHLSAAASSLPIIVRGFSLSGLGLSISDYQPSKMPWKMERRNIKMLRSILSVCIHHKSSFSSAFRSIAMDTPIRRVITGHDSKGKAYFASDENLTPYDPTTAPEFSTPGPNSGFGIVQIHRSRGFPADNMADLPDPHRTLVPLADTKGPSCRVLHLPPAEHGWMHRTLSLDYFVVLSGTIGLVTDGGVEKILYPHDVVVCRGTNHEWVNRGKDVATLFAVVVPSKEVVTEDGVRLEKTPAGPVYDPPEEE